MRGGCCSRGISVLISIDRYYEFSNKMVCSECLKDSESSKV